MDAEAGPLTSLGFSSDQGIDFTDVRSQSEESHKSRGSKASNTKDKKTGEKKVKKKLKSSEKKTQAKAKASGHRKGNGSKSSPEDDWKKCKDCAKWKDAKTDFNADQSRCKDCFNHDRSLTRMAERQGCKGTLAQMQRDDPKQHAAMLKAFIKERESSKKAGDKIKFSIKTFRVAYQSRDGVRGEELGEMMWEGEYMEFAKTAKAGFLSSQEAIANWQKWKEDESVARDNNGPRGYLRLYVKTGDRVVKFQEVGEQKELTQEEKLGKKPSEATLDNRMKFLAGSHGLEEHKLGDIQSLKQKGLQSFGSSQSLQGEGLMGPSLDALQAQVQAKMKRRNAEENEESSSQSADEGNEERQSDSKEKDSESTPEKSKGGWFDAAAKTRKAERTYSQKIAALKVDLAKLDERMSEVVADFQAKPDEAVRFAEEILLVQRRQEWIQAVSIQGDDALKQKISQLTGAGEAHGAGDAATQTDSKDVGALARAGPCAGFEELKTIVFLESLAPSFRSCQSQDQIKKRFEEIAPHQKQIAVLVSACKTALGDLLTARKNWNTQQDKKKEKEVKEQAEKKRQSNGSTGVLVVNSFISNSCITRQESRPSFFDFRVILFFESLCPAPFLALQVQPSPEGLRKWHHIYWQTLIAQLGKEM